MKTRTYTPKTGTSVAGLEKEQQDSIDCTECLPLCSDVRYTVGAMSMQMHPEGDAVAWRTKLRGEKADLGMKVAERMSTAEGEGNSSDSGGDETAIPEAVAVVKIYHAQRRSLLYVQDVVSEWFNMLSTYFRRYDATVHVDGNWGVTIMIWVELNGEW